MKILYLSCHAILEYDEVSLLTELGHDVFSMGAYSNPEVDCGMRPAIKGAKFHPELQAISIQCSKENIHPELVKWADVIFSMHNARIPKFPVSKKDVDAYKDTPEQPWIVNNWRLFEGKRVIWRSIGQSTEKIERELANYKENGLQIVRYSPKEKNIPSYAGENAMIRFYKDPKEFSNWDGKEKVVINFTQSLRKRGDHCGYETWLKGTEGLERKVYGPENESLGKANGGLLSYEEQKEKLRTARAYFYYGTVPASYTLSFIEAMMTGTPMVAAAPSFSRHIYNQDTNEISDILQNEVNGFIGNSVDEIRDYIKFLFENEDEAKKISEEGRRTALQLFGKEQIMRQWAEFLG